MLHPSSHLEEEVRTGLVAVDGRTFPLKSTRIGARAEGGVAATTLVQDYANPHAEPLEVVYTMPLPADGAVTSYTIRLGDRVITGRIERREEAQALYQKALEEGRTAGLLQEERADTFTQKLGSLPPGVEVRVEIEILHPVAFRVETGEDGPQWEYRFPTVVGVRYEGNSGRVPDARHLDVDRADAAGTPVLLEVDLLVADGLPELAAPRSPSHTIACRPEGTGATRVVLESPSRLDRDLVVRWRAAGERIGARLVPGRGLAGDQGRYALLTITPPRAPRASFARDLTILIDASGSMAGTPIDHAKQIALKLLSTLGREDRFEILSFSNQVEKLTPGFVSPMGPAQDKALAALRALRAGGSTEMAKAVAHALESLRPDSQRQVVLLTDGYIGFEHEIVAEILAKLPAGARLHTIGIGQAPNRTLTQAAARAGRGIELIVGANDDAHDAALRICHATAAPVLTEIVVRGGAVIGVAPTRMPDLFAGRPALLALELRACGGTIEIEGRIAGSSAPWIERIEVGDDASGHLPLGAFFGRERVLDCEMRLAATNDSRQSSALLGELEAIALRHKIVSRRTSLVAISEDPTVDPGDPRRRVRLAVELPAGVSAEGAGLVTRRFNQLMCTEPMIGSGAFAVEQRFSFTSVSHRARSIPSIIEGRVVRQEGDLLVVEFEAPPDGISIPGGDTEVMIFDEAKQQATARIVAELSTRPGAHKAGLTIRLALRVKGGPVGPGSLVLGWQADGNDFIVLLRGAESSR